MNQDASTTTKKITSIQNLPRHKKATDHLYLRGNIYYFRYALPKSMKDRVGHAEIRISLRTGFLQEARKLSRCLWSILMEEIMPDQERTFQEIKDCVGKAWEEKHKSEAPRLLEGRQAPDLEHPENMRFFKQIASAEQEASAKPDPYESMATLHTYLARELDMLFPNKPNRVPPNIAEIKEKMDVLLHMLLDEIDSSLYEVRNEFFIDSGNSLSRCTVPYWLNEQYAHYLSPLTNNPAKLIHTYFPTILQEMVERKLFSPNDFTPESVIYILNEYNKVLISINRIHFHRYQGEFAYEKTFSKNYPKKDYIHQQSQIDKPEPLMLSTFIKQFIDTKIKDRKWQRRAVPDHKNRIELLLDILGDIPVSDIDRVKMREFREILIQLPPNRKKDKRYRDKSVREIIAMKPQKTLSIGTIDTTLTTISGMFEWGIKEELLDKNPARDLCIADPEQAIDKREPLTEEDINTIFFTGDYKRENFANPAYYWVPLIALYTGMRLEEICQLHTEDVYQEEGVWLFDIRTESTDGLKDKILKNKNSARKIPLHKHLIDLGLLDYIAKVSQNSLRLFPDLNKTDRSPKYGKQVGKQFSILLKEKGITGKKSFHSLRHTFSNYFKKLNLHTDLFTQIMGHKQEKLAAHRYGSRFSPKQCYDELISKIDWHGKD